MRCNSVSDRFRMSIGGTSMVTNRVPEWHPRWVSHRRTFPIMLNGRQNPKTFRKPEQLHSEVIIYIACWFCVVWFHNRPFSPWYTSKRIGQKRIYVISWVGAFQAACRVEEVYEIAPVREVFLKPVQPCPVNRTHWELPYRVKLGRLCDCPSF